MLGPGTSISAAAATSCTRSGTTIMFTGGGGVPAVMVVLVFPVADHDLRVQQRVEAVDVEALVAERVR